MHGTTHALDIANQLTTLLLSGNFFSCEGTVAIWHIIYKQYVVGVL